MGKNAIERFFSPRRASEIYGMSEGALANLRHHRRGPKYFKVGRKVFYRQQDLDFFWGSNPIETRDSVRGCNISVNNLKVSEAK